MIAALQTQCDSPHLQPQPHTVPAPLENLLCGVGSNE